VTNPAGRTSRQIANIKPNSKILDIGCGFGASSIYLARKHHAQAIGGAISPRQVEMTNQAASQAGVSASFLCMDGETLDTQSNGFAQLFDVLWSRESLSHYQDVPHFFASASRLLKPGGTLAFTD
jgi:cyclopropane fatty-acyl-phospholipid synthase-like methyltransferase